MPPLELPVFPLRRATLAGLLSWRSVPSLGGQSWIEDTQYPAGGTQITRRDEQRQTSGITTNRTSRSYPCGSRHQARTTVRLGESQACRQTPSGDSCPPVETAGETASLNHSRFTRSNTATWWSEPVRLIYMKPLTASARRNPSILS